jgi:hypothetical protein
MKLQILRWGLCALLLLALTACNRDPNGNITNVKQDTAIIEKSTKEFSPGSDTHENSDQFALDTANIIDASFRKLVWIANLKLARHNYSEYIADSTYQEGSIFNSIQQVIKHRKFRSYHNDVRKLLAAEGLTIACTDDGKIYTISITGTDAVMGGSDQSEGSMMYFIHDSTTVLSSLDSVAIGQKWVRVFEGILNSSELTTLQTKNGTSYVISGISRICNSCFRNSIQLITIRDKRIVVDFSFNIESREPDVIYYDTNERKIYVVYDSDDLTPECPCTTIDRSTMETSDGEIHRECECVYVFNGTTFELVRETSNKPQM